MLLSNTPSVNEGFIFSFSLQSVSKHSRLYVKSETILLLMIYSQDYRWSCGRECDTGTFTSPENDPEELREMWTDLQSCGDPCGCS